MKEHSYLEQTFEMVYINHHKYYNDTVYDVEKAK